MLKHEVLISKGFELNTYNGDKYYELVATDSNLVERIMKASNYDYNPEYHEEKVILQIREDFESIILCIDCNVWNLTEEEIVDILNII